MPYPESIELWDSGVGSLTGNDNGTLTRNVTPKWLVSGKPSYLAAEAWGVANAPEYLLGHRRKNLSCRPLGNQWWEIEAHYENAAIPSSTGDGNGSENGNGDPVANTVAFDTTGGTEHITTAVAEDPLKGFGVLGEMVYPGASGEYVRYDGLINVSGGTVHGVDIVVPQFQFTETWVMPSAWILDSYVNTLYRLTGTINLKQFRVFTEGECLFLGARCEMNRGATMAAITYQFSARPTRKNFKVGDVTVQEKRGWDYMWVSYRSSVVSGAAVQRPHSVYVNQVYELGDFSKLALGTTFPAVYEPRSVANGDGQQNANVPDGWG